MAAIKYFTNEFQDGQGWKCMNDADLGNGSNIWWKFPRSIGMSIEDYIVMLVKEFKVDHIEYSFDADVLKFAWDKQADMRKFKNWANRKYRTMF